MPAPIEATAYFVVAEALTNVTKHANAASAAVAARVEDGTLRVEIGDDAVGGARPEGSGLQGLADRLAALDGAARSQVPRRGRDTGHSRHPRPGERYQAIARQRLALSAFARRERRLAVPRRRSRDRLLFDRARFVKRLLSWVLPGFEVCSFLFSALGSAQSVRGSCLGFSIPCRAVRRPERSGSLPRQGAMRRRESRRSWMIGDAVTRIPGCGCFSGPGGGGSRRCAGRGMRVGWCLAAAVAAGRLHNFRGVE